MPDATEPKVLPLPAHGDVDLEQVGFSYEPEAADRGLHAARGTRATVAMVGPRGAGKTTMVDLLMRFYEIQGGHIFVDGVDAALAAATTCGASSG